jgi:hypothetical protein
VDPQGPIITRTMAMAPTPRGQFARAFRKVEPPPRPAPDEPDAPRARARRPDPEQAERAERERRVQRALEDDEKRALIEDGADPRQPPEYRGHVFDHADSDGVHPTAFPPLRWGPQDGLSDEFIAFQSYNGTTYEKNPEYYCVRCRIRYNARAGGLCGPCIGQLARPAPAQAPLFDDAPQPQPTLPEYPT